MNKFESGLPRMTIDKAKMAIGEIRQNIALMGANDSEFHVIDEILADLETGKFGPEDAVEEAHKVLSSKQDYH